MTINSTYGGYDAFAVAQSGIQSNIQSGTLESSNVDMSSAMVNQINAQNGVEANAQSVQTADAMMQTLLDIQA